MGGIEFHIDGAACKAKCLITDMVVLMQGKCIGDGVRFSGVFVMVFDSEWHVTRHMILGLHIVLS